MAWRIWKDHWPNGRAFWTVEDREAREVLIGKRGGIARYHDRDMARAAAAEMRGKASAEPEADLIDHP